MKPSIARVLVTAASLLTGAASAEPPEASQQDRLDRYTIVRLSSLGGTDSSGNSINDERLVAGYSNLSGDSARHATLWLHGFRFDLGTLGGPNSNVAWPVKNTVGLIAGIAQTATPEPLGQGWSCRAFFPAATGTGFICLGVVWERGEIIELPTLGGFNGFATGANNLRQVVGWTENNVQDPTCVRPLQVLQFRPVIWGPDLRQVQALPLLPQDTAGAATAINDRGQVVGISGACGTAVGGVTARNAVLWEKGTVTNIGNLGGVAWNTPMAINEHGDVVGFSNVNANDGATFNARAFLWTRGRGIRSLGTLPGDALSQARGINDHGQIVGISCTAGCKLPCLLVAERRDDRPQRARFGRVQRAVVHCQRHQRARRNHGPVSRRHRGVIGLGDSGATAAWTGAGQPGVAGEARPSRCRRMCGCSSCSSWD